MKSHERFSLSLLSAVYKDACRKCGVDPDHRDLGTLRSRTYHEGLQFLSVTLPTLGTDLESVLEQGKVGSHLFRSFGKRCNSPRLFGVLFSRVISGTGLLVDEPDPLAIQGIRQLAYLFKKPKEVCSDAKCKRAFDSFIDVEQTLTKFQIREDDSRDFVNVCRYLWDSTWSSFCIEDLVPKHGPGATAERDHGNAKFMMKRYHDRLESYFPLSSFAWHTEDAGWTGGDFDTQFVKESDEQPVRVIAVPKTVSKPRIIAIEPVCMQFIQQGISRWLVSQLEHGVLTKGHINFKDQSINQYLALVNSVTKEYSTIDLSDASDRVLNILVLLMFSGNLLLSEAIQACRSSRADVAGRVIPLAKFASMGSALCFPIEAMVFYTICILGHIRNAQKEISYESVKNASREIYVYGDDIIAPVTATPRITATLEDFCLKVNVQKSFSNGNFRESCGCDAYGGTDVTPIYVRRHLHRSATDDQSFVSSVETANQFAQKGYWKAFNNIRKVCEKKHKLPYVGPKSQGLGWVLPDFVEPSNIAQECSLIDCYARARWNSKHQCVEYKTLVVTTAKKRDRLTGSPALAKWALSRGTHNHIDSVYPTRKSVALSSEAVSAITGADIPILDYKSSVRRGAVTLKSRWVRPY